MSTSAYNLGNAGFANKILRTKDLKSSAGAGVSPILGMEEDIFWLTFDGLTSLEEHLRIPEFGSSRWLSQGWMSHKINK
jgi:hypothetical protein